METFSIMRLFINEKMKNKAFSLMRIFSLSLMRLWYGKRSYDSEFIINDNTRGKTFSLMRLSNKW